MVPSHMMVADSNYGYVSYQVPSYVDYAEPRQPGFFQAISPTTQITELPRRESSVKEKGRDGSKKHDKDKGDKRRQHHFNGASQDKSGHKGGGKYRREHAYDQALTLELDQEQAQSKEQIFDVQSFEPDFTIDRISGNVLILARDSRGCRFLQAVLEDLTVDPLLKSAIFAEAMPELTKLLGEPLGNYFFQKLFETCPADRQMQILAEIADNLIEACKGVHSTRSIQKVITVSASNEVLVAEIVKILQPRTLELCFDPNACHVIQSCLQSFSLLSNLFIFETIRQNCISVASHRQGCRIIQKCLQIEKNVGIDDLLENILAFTNQLIKVRIIMIIFKYFVSSFIIFF